MSRILFITRHYLSDNNGGANASKGFIHAFAQLYSDMSLIYPEHENQESFNQIPLSVHGYPCYDYRRKIQKGMDIYRGRLHRLTDFVIDHIKHHAYNIIVLDHSLTAATIIRPLKSTGAKIITIHHNVELYYNAANPVSALYRIPYNHYAKRAEQDALLLSDINLTLTESDKETFTTWYPKTNLHLHSVGICEYRLMEQKNFDIKKRQPIFAISGSLQYPQSYRPIIHFLRYYYPLLKARCPEARLIIAGRNPNKKLIYYASQDTTIELIINPDNMIKEILRADYYLCPIDRGSGIKLRLLDGLKNGMPILTHDIASIGYEFLFNKNILFTYHDEQTFIQSLDRLLATQTTSQCIYDMLCQNFDIQSMMKKLKTIIK